MKELKNCVLVTLQPKNPSQGYQPVPTVVAHRDLHEYVEEHLSSEVVIVIASLSDYTPKIESNEEE